MPAASRRYLARQNFSTAPSMTAPSVIDFDQRGPGPGNADQRQGAGQVRRPPQLGEWHGEVSVVGKKSPW